MHLCHNGKSILHVRKGEAKNAGGAPVLLHVARRAAGPHAQAPEPIIGLPKPEDVYPPRTSSYWRE
jgi:hypothetical protein